MNAECMDEVFAYWNLKGKKREEQVCHFYTHKKVA